jgi:hypothetical protein
LVFAEAIGIARRGTGQVFDGIISRVDIGHRRPRGHVIPNAVPARMAPLMRVSLAGRHVSVNAFAT